MSILISLALLMYLAYRGISVLVLAPLLAMLAVILGGDTRLLAMYTQVFMTGLGGFLVKYFPLFLLGAIFGRLMSDSGAADTIARAIVARIGAQHAILALVLSCGLLTYGGVSVFVVAFAAYPVGVGLFREAGIPKRLIPGALVLGSATFTMTALPGTPSIQNAIPMPYFGTDAFAAPGLGVIAGLIMFAGGAWWLTYRAAVARAAGEGYGTHPTDIMVPHIAGASTAPSLVTALVPVLLVIGLNLAFTRWVIPSMDTAYLAEKTFGGVTVNDVRGVWSLIAAIFIAIVATIAMHWPRWRDLRQSINEGTMGSLLPIFNTASEVGYGSVIAALAAFAVIRDAVIGLSPGNPLLSEALAVNIMAGITGSSSGGLSIALNMLGKSYLELGTTAGISPQLLHRVAAVASGGLDSLPHNGAIITLLAICHLTHRESYLDIFVVSVVVPLLALVALLVLGTTFGTF
ncbi:GntP family permease [Gemmatimonas sp.]|jgi:H+/gluconate symporter-like permease|uniref:GntP family permease n=1 Tax=Gemmatimonas sp. TaxID=1962908 RepID=UPI0037C00251